MGRSNTVRKTALTPLRYWIRPKPGEIRGLYVVGGKSAWIHTPTGSETEKALGNLEFLVVQDLFLTSTAKMAHAVLPVGIISRRKSAHTRAPKDLVQRIRPVLTPAKGKSDMEIFTALAALMGSPAMTYAGPEQVINEIASMINVYRGIWCQDGWLQAVCRGHVWIRKILERAYFTRAGSPGERPGSRARGAGRCSVKRWAAYRDWRQGFLNFIRVLFPNGAHPLMEVCPEGFAEMNSKDMKNWGCRKKEREDHFARRTAIRANEKVLSGPKGNSDCA